MRGQEGRGKENREEQEGKKYQERMKAKLYERKRKRKRSDRSERISDREVVAASCVPYAVLKIALSIKSLSRAS